MEGKKIDRNYEWVKSSLERNKKVVFEYRRSLLIEILGMMINNMAFIFVWYIVFKEFGDIRGWGFQELFLLNAFVAFIYGVTNIFFRGSSEISRKVMEGQLDQYITQPKSVLFSVLFSEVSASAVGDLVEGLISLIIYMVISQTPFLFVFLFFPIALLSTGIWIGFLIATQSIVFWIPNSEEISFTLLNMTLGTALNPNKAFSTIPKLFFTFILPATLLGTVPSDIFINPTLSQLLLLFGMFIFWVFLGTFLFNQGLKRYESGNVFGGT
jgi:ABC-2 type transport system permease protein